MKNMIERKPGRWEFRDAPSGKVIKIYVNYSKGGLNVWHGNQERRGYSIHVTPVEIKDGFERMTIDFGIDKNVSGFRIFVQEVGRESKKTAQTLAARIDERVVEWAKMFRENGAQAAGEAIKEYLNPAPVTV